jgi:hypothetical protein
VTDALVVAVSIAVVFLALAPDAVLTDSSPWRTDLTGHLVIPWLDRTDVAHVLPGAWSDAWFAGFPLNQLYPPLPAVLAALLSTALPLAVAFKIIVVLPQVALPGALYVSARLARLPFPLPALLAVASLPFLFDTACVTCGGNIPSTINGEYAFAWGLVFAVLALGSVDRLAQGIGSPIPAALLTTAAALSHPLPTLWLVLGIAVVLVGRRVWADRSVTRSVATAAVAAALMSCWWWLPFLARRDWMPLLGFERRDDLGFWLLPASTWWEAILVCLAVGGTVWAVRQRWWFLVAIAVLSVVAVLAFLAIGAGGQLYNLRVLPFWYLGRWVLAFVGMAGATEFAARRWRASWVQVGSAALPLVAIATSVTVIGSTWGWWGVVTPPSDGSDGRARILGPRRVRRTTRLPRIGRGSRSAPNDRCRARLRTADVGLRRRRGARRRAVRRHAGDGAGGNVDRGVHDLRHRSPRRLKCDRSLDRHDPEPCFPVDLARCAGI